LEFNVPFQHKHGYVRDEAIPEKIWGGELSLPSETRLAIYINLNPGCLFVQQPPKKVKRSRGSFKLLCWHLQQERQLSHHKTKL